MNYIKKTIHKLYCFIHEFCKNVFSHKLFMSFFIILLFLIGIIHWVVFFNYGELSFNAYDWPKELNCYSVLQQSLKQGLIPYHVSRALPYDATDRFLALPEIILSPQLILLPLMSLQKFIIFNTLFMYSIGFIGCLLIRKKYKLSILPFTILYLLFNYNGHITSHISIGHSMWNGYFLLPFFCLFILELVEGKKNINSVIKLSLVLFIIILQGSLHMFIWCLLFMLLLAIFHREYLRQILSVILLSSLLSSFRLIPAAITFYNKGYRFMTGYPTIRDLFDALTAIRDHTYKYLGGIMANLGSWEYDAYIGIIGLAVILYFGIYLRFIKNPNIKNYHYKDLDIPIALMVLFSLSSFYAFIAILPIPFLNSERVSSRFLIIPLLMLLIISCIRIQQLLYIFKKNLTIRLLSIFGILQMTFSLIGHSKTWRIETLEEAFANRIINLSIQIVNKQDVLYKASVKISAVISLLTILFLLCFCLWHVLKTKKY